MNGTSAAVYTILSLSHLRIKLGHAATMVAAASLVFGALPVHSQEQNGRPDSLKPPMRKNTTAAEFEAKMQASKSISDFKSAQRDVSIQRPTRSSDPYEGLIFISDGSDYTMVPDGSVLALPAGYRNRIVDKPKGTLVPWPAFVEKNKGWIGGWEVSVEMMKGDPELAKSVMKSISQDTRVLVALYKGHPVTVLEAVPEKGSRASDTTKE